MIVSYGGLFRLSFAGPSGQTSAETLLQDVGEDHRCR